MRRLTPALFILALFCSSGCTQYSGLMSEEELRKAVDPEITDYCIGLQNVSHAKPYGPCWYITCHGFHDGEIGAVTLGSFGYYRSNGLYYVTVDLREEMDGRSDRPTMDKLFFIIKDGKVIYSTVLDVPAAEVQKQFCS